MHYDAFSKRHPLVNFIFFMGAIGCTVVIQHPAYIAAGCVCAAAYLMMLSRKAWKLVLGLIPVFVFISGVNPLFNDYGQRVLFTLFGRPYTLEALLYGMAIAGIFVSMLLWFGCYSRVLTSDKFVALFGGLIPALSLLLVMVLRMIPDLIRKCRHILASRGSIGKGAGADRSPKEKLRDGVSILSALTDWALEGSIITADSMRSRGYGIGKRTNFRLYRMTGTDWALLLFMGALIGITLTAGGTEAAYTPELSIARPTMGLVTYVIFLLIPIVMQIKEMIQWHICVSRI